MNKQGIIVAAVFLACAGIISLGSILQRTSFDACVDRTFFHMQEMLGPNRIQGEANIAAAKYEIATKCR